jgi:hypothetical protein
MSAPYDFIMVIGPNRRFKVSTIVTISFHGVGSKAAAQGTLAAVVGRAEFMALRQPLEVAMGLRGIHAIYIYNIGNT